MIGRTILESERDIFHQGSPLVGHPVAIAIDELRNVGWMEEIKPVVIPNQSPRRIHIGHENLYFIGLSVVIEIPDTENASAMLFAIERAVAVAGNVESSIGQRTPLGI